MYVEELIGPDTVNTMPEERSTTIRITAIRGHGSERASTRRIRYSSELARGRRYDEITETLEREGVEKFSGSFEQLLDGLRQRAAALTSHGP